MCQTAETGLGLAGTNELQHRLITDQRLSDPVSTNGAEHAMLDGIPFGGACGIMGNGNGQMEFVGQGLQSNFPQPTIASIRAAGICFHQQLMGSPAVASCNNSSKAFMISGLFFQPASGLLRFAVSLRRDSVADTEPHFGLDKSYCGSAQ